MPLRMCVMASSTQHTQHTRVRDGVQPHAGHLCAQQHQRHATRRMRPALSFHQPGAIPSTTPCPPHSHEQRHTPLHLRQTVAWR